MYAVIRSGGKQYRVAPGDVIKVESLPKGDDRVQFEVLAVSPEDGGLRSPQGTTVTGEVVENGRHDKILVFHFKRKKQYKRLRGHRQPFTAVRISEITVDGQRFAAPEAPVKEKKQRPAKAAPAEAPEASAEAKAPKKAAAKKAPAKKAAAKPSAKKGASSKATGKKKGK